jgi:putative drug exporter of the RND superfamily
MARLKGSDCAYPKGDPVEHLARLCARKRFIVLGGWVIGLLLLAGLTVRLGSGFTDSTQIPNSESATAYSLLDNAGHGGLVSSNSTVSGNIAWHVTGASVTSQGVEKDVAAMLGQVAHLPGVEAVVSPYSAAGAAQVSPSANTAYATVTLAKGSNVQPVEQAAEQLRSAAMDVQTGGTAFTPPVGASQGTEVIGILAALLILLLVFRSVWAAVLPVITGVTGVGLGLLAVVLGSHLISLSSTSLTMGSLIGLGVGIDYALFIVNRYRKALLDGVSVPDAIAKALATSGRAVVFAGVTVVAALLGMYVVNLSVLTGMAEAAAVTVLLTVASATTLLPALLAILGKRVLSRRQRRTLASGQRAITDQAGEGRTAGTHARAGRGAAARWAGLVQRAPRRAATLSLLAIVALAIPVLSMRIGTSDASSDPAGSSTRAYYDVMAGGFGRGFDAPLLLVAQAPDAPSQQALAKLATELPAAADVASVTTPATVGKGLEVITVLPRTSGQAAATSDLVTSLRHDVIPAAEAGSHLHVYVGGTTASSTDLSNALMSKLPLYLVLIGLLGFVLLALAFRSVLIPLTGALTSLGSILAGLGAITAIFQFGWGSSLFGVGSAAPVSYIIPVCIVGVVFGLSTDYQVFLISRMREEWQRTGDNARSVRQGASETAKVIVMAMAIMACVFGSFGFSGERIVASIGVGMASAVIIDALLVRLTLVPALMQLAGRWNWAYPRWAERLTPRVSVEAQDGTEHEATRPSAIIGS